jgi:mediator of RNA polymerase II transcription subunit 16, fungi type
MLVHSVQWTLDLVAWLTDCLYELMNDDRFIQCLAPTKSAELAAYMLERRDISLQLLTCSSSRSFLVALCRRVAHLEALGKRAMEFYRRQSASGEANLQGKSANPQLRQAYQKLGKVTTAGNVSVTEFEKLVNTLGSGIMKAYEAVLPGIVKRQANPPQGKQEDEAIKAARAHLETSMLFASSPAVPFLPVIKKFFSDELPAFRRATDPAALFFTKFDVLTVEDCHALGGVKDSQIDALSKTKLQMTPQSQWRRCTRCTSVMEELGGRGPGLTFMVTQQRRCPCSGCWSLMPKGKPNL